MRIFLTVLISTLAFSSAAVAEPSLRGSPSSMQRQYEIAKSNDYTFLRTPAQVMRYVEDGWLVPIEGDENYELARVSFPFGRPETKLFVERLAAQYREGCGEKLVVTSLVRPTNLQPRNSHALSVHPTGMAIDFRVSSNANCVRWLEDTLLSLEAQGLLDVTREYRPPHFHVALFTQRYAGYVGEILSDSIRQVEQQRVAMLQALVEEAQPMFAASFLAAPEKDESDSSINWTLMLAIPIVLIPIGVRTVMRSRN